MELLLNRITNRLPAPLRHRVMAARLAGEVDRLRRALPAAAPRHSPPQRLLIVSSDPRTLVGARGDEAMITAVVSTLRRSNADLRVAVMTGTPAASAAARALGLEPIELWEPFDLAAIAAALHDFGPDIAVLIGADVMDGHYSVQNTLRRLAVTELAARGGARACITGFSFNERPTPALAAVFERIAGRVTFNVRDPVSLARFQSFCAAKAHLVADVAFLLEPDITPARRGELMPWVESRRAAGDRVVVVNLHPMLLGDAEPGANEALVRSTAAVLGRLAVRESVSWLLLPHDFRGARGDNACLAPLAQQLDATLGERAHHAAGPWSAAELKAIAGATDAVFTGRMHLAIAALGQGVPVAAVTYQGKFEGLWQHFDLPLDLLLAPADALDEAQLEATLMRLIGALEPLSRQVRQRLPAMQALALSNFDGLVGSGRTAQAAA